MEHASPFVILLIVLFCAPVLYYIRKAKKGLDIFIRRIPGVSAVDDALGRAVEMGRPISFTTGLVSISPLLYACLGVLKYIAKKTALFGSRIIVPSYDPEAMVLADATLQSAYHSEKKFSAYDPSSVRYLSSEQFAYASGYMGLVHRENVACAFLFGAFAAESLILAEAGQQVGAIQVAATVSNEQVPFFITACDYTLIGEELYAAGAFLSEDPVQTGSLKGQDIAKIIILFLIIWGIAQSTIYTIISGVETKAPLIEWINASWGKIF